VAKVRQEYGLQPWRRETFKFSTDPDPDPELEVKVRDVTGLYLNPPDKAVVLCVMRSRRSQALERTATVRPYLWHGTTTLFAALETATGKVADACYPRHRHEEFLQFLRQVAKAYLRRQLHVVTDTTARTSTRT
jgi:hypothetical protein